MPLAPSMSPDKLKLLLSELNNSDPKVMMVEAAPEYSAGRIFLMMSYLRDSSPPERKDDTLGVLKGDWRD